MTKALAQIWMGSTFEITREELKAQDAVILHCSGHLTAREEYNSLTPDEVEELFELRQARSGSGATLLVVDLAGVPYMDSQGLELLIAEYFRLKEKGVKLVAAGMTPHVIDRLKSTHLGSVLPLAATVADALQGRLMSEAAFNSQSLCNETVPLTAP